MKKRILSCLLLAALMLPSFASCSETTTTADTDTASAAEETAAVAEAEADATEEVVEEELGREAEQDNLPDEDFGGKTYIIWGYDTTASNTVDFSKFIISDELNGELINDSVYYRNLAIDERFNAKISLYIAGNYDTVTPLIQSTVLAGDSEAFHLASYHVVSSSSNAIKGYYMNWYDLPYVDFSRNWWSSSNTEDLTYNNVCFLAMGDVALSTISQTYVMIYDKTAAANNGINDIYETVKNGKWTLAALREICENVYSDTNGDGEADEGDFYGLGTDCNSNFNTYYWAFDNKIMEKGESGELEFSYYDEHLVDCFDSLRSFLYEEDVTYISSTHSAGVTYLSNYNCLFANGLLSSTQSMLSDFEHEYGIIPYPKYDEAQTEYKTMVDGNHEAMSVGKMATDLEFIGVITEALCAESYKKVVPNYLDVCLKERYSSSPEDAEMVDIAIAGRVFDFGYVYDNWAGAAFTFQNILSGSTDITSYCQKQNKVWNKYYEKVLRSFTNYTTETEA